MADSITFKYTLTVNDFIKAIRAHNRSTIPRVILWIALSALALVGTFSAIRRMSDIGVNAGSITLLVWVTVGPALLAWWSWSIYPRRVANNSPFLNVECEAVALSEGIKWNSPLAKGEAGWKIYIDVLETVDQFLLYGGKNFFYIYPKRGFAAPGDVKRFRDLLRANIPSARLLE